MKNPIAAYVAEEVFGVPIKLVASKFRAYGKKLDKWHPYVEKVSEPSPNVSKTLVQNTSILRMPPSSLTSTTKDIAPECRPFCMTNEEYQFYYVKVPFKGSYGKPMCRVCGKVIWGKAERKTHLGMGCSKELISVMKTLHRTRICVCCNKETHKTMWGFPMCGGPCSENWRTGVVSKPTEKALRGLE